MSDSLSKLHPLAVLGRAHGASGTSLHGYCATTFAALSALLGEPHERDVDKTTVEWAFRCHDGTIFTVYDWEESSTPAHSYWWHIGGTGRPLEAFMRHTGLKAVPLRSSDLPTGQVAG